MRRGVFSVDYDGDGDAADTINKDLNNDGSTAVIFTDYNDWSNINLFFQRSYSGDASGVIGQNALFVMDDPVEDDFQEVIIETLTPDHIR